MTLKMASVEADWQVLRRRRDDGRHFRKCGEQAVDSLSSTVYLVLLQFYEPKRERDNTPVIHKPSISMSQFPISGLVDAVRFWRESKNKIEVQNIGLQYYGAEKDTDTGDLLLHFALQMDLVNKSNNRAEEVAYSLEVEQPPASGETRRTVHTFESMVFDSIESRRSFEPFFIRTDFSKYMWLSNDHPDWPGRNQIRTHSSFSWDIKLRLKVTSSTHRGNTKAWPVLTLLMEWVKENEGRSLRELEYGLWVPWKRKKPSEDQLDLVIGEDFSLPPS
jgi:hypothetical protein